MNENRIYTIQEITKCIKNTLETNPELNNVWVKGEIYNLTYHSSGHIYFTLKDTGAQLSAVFFKYANKSLSFRLENGMSIFVYGSITLFEKRGSYQINVLRAKLEGVGELQKRIEQLKEKLLKEGIFDPSLKKPLPFLPGRIGVVTSPTGAAFRDILKVALRRYPDIEIVLAPAKVQGDDAARTIAAGIRELNEPRHNIDVIIAGRGGGSFEDLMPFNEESVIRAFHESIVPIVSAVGHQIDHPLSDDAADSATPTPSAAAEIVVPVKKDLFDEIEYMFIRISRNIESKINSYQQRYQAVAGKRVMRDPFELIRSSNMLLTEFENRAILRMKDIISEKKNRLLKAPDLNKLIKNYISGKMNNFNSAVTMLNKLSPLSTLKRGYSVIKDCNEYIIRSIKTVNIGDRINAQLHDGMLDCTVNSIKEGKTIGKEKIE